MSQGYGQQNNSMDPYGQQPAGEQQWGQAPAPAGYPGSAGATTGTSPAPSSTIDKLTKWLLILAIAVVGVRLLQFIIGVIAGFALSAPAAAGGDIGGTALGGGIVALLMMLVNGLVSLALLVLAIVVAVQARGRGRTGAIIVAGALVVAVVLFWILYAIQVVTVGGAADPSSVNTWHLVISVLDIGRGLLIAAALIVGAIMARRWAKQNAGAARTA